MGWALFALVVALAFARSRRPITHHAVFALHRSAFSLLLVSLSQFPSPGEWYRIPMDFVIVVGSLVYLVVALRRVYEESAGRVRCYGDSCCTSRIK